MKPTQTSETWSKFYDAARTNDALDERTRVLLHLATSMAVACEP